MEGRVKWISNLKAKWYVARHGSSWVYVEVKGTQRRGEPILIRTIYVMGKGGKPEAVYSEVYSIDKAMEVIEAERAIVEGLRAYEGSDHALFRLKSQVSRLESILNLIKNTVKELEEVINYGK